MKDFLGHEVSFWGATVIASLLKVVFSKRDGLFNIVITFLSAIFAAIVFTDPLLDWLNLNPLKYKSGMAAVVALTGEQIMRAAIRYAQDPSGELRRWRRGKED